MIAAALLLLAQPGSAEAAALESIEDSDPGETCESPQTQSAMNACAALDLARADDALNAQWALTAARMKELDGEVLREQDRQPGYHETLLDAQRAWLRFRDAHCLSESFMARGGSMQPMLDSGCKAALTNARTAQLRDLAGQ
jgi:uncharacterized protein YecT (DUF1311 family)